MNKIFYFTSTGNSLYVAKEIQKRIGGELISIPKALKEGRLEYNGDKIGIIYPCYAWQAPDIVKEFIEKAKIKGKYNFSVMTYGKMTMGGVEVFRRLCEKNSIKINYGSEILMVDNYIPMLDINKEMEILDKKRIPENLNKIASDIENEREFIKGSNFLKIFASSHIYKIMEGVFRRMPEKFSIEDSCTKCGVCVKVCPVSNISMTEKGPEFSNKCIACLGCTNNCPVNCIRVTKERSKARFRNENITLKEIIDSNN